MKSFGDKFTKISIFKAASQKNLAVKWIFMHQLICCSLLKEKKKQFVD